MFDIVLYQPEIPPNTGNIIRATVNAGARLHLVKPLGFELTDKTLARAGLDYISLSDLRVYEDWEDCRRRFASRRMFAVSTRGAMPYAGTSFREGDAFLFGPESRGLPAAVLEQFPPACVLRIPMRPDNRSVNLSNAVAIVLYEAWRQHGFAGGH
jgi:tRNA (cytidine/uridine-2'-O-)-methyltransferase